MNTLLEIDPQVCHGKPVIAGTRIPISVIVEQFGLLHSIDDVLAQFPELRVEQIEAALKYSHSSQNRHVGSNLDDFLAEEGIKESVETAALKKVIKFQME